MRFESLPPGDAEGMILVHGLRVSGRLFKKGRVLRSTDIGMLKEAGIERVTVIKLEPTDVPEDLAATSVARALSGAGIRLSAAFTGRVNLYGEQSGIVVLDRERIDRINLIDESVTVATLSPYAVVQPGEMIAT